MSSSTFKDLWSKFGKLQNVFISFLKKQLYQNLSLENKFLLKTE